MRKEELRSLKRINATRKMEALAKNNKKDMKYLGKTGASYITRKTMYDMMVRCQTRGKYLMVCLFFPDKVAAGELTPTYEIYINPEGNEYITRILDKGKELRWSGAMAFNLEKISDFIWNYTWYQEMTKRVWQNPEGMNTIQRVLHTENKGIFGVMEWQKKTKDRKIMEAEEREQAPWDADMNLVPEIVPSFEGWLKKEGPGKYFIFYEYERKGAEEGYCSHCQKTVPVRRPRHNAWGQCPKCGKKVQYKASSRVQTLDTGKYRGEIIQKIKGGVVIRRFWQEQWYRNTGYKEPRSRTREVERTLLMGNGIVKRYIYGLYKNKKYRWILDKNYAPNVNTYYRQITVKLYKRNLGSLKRTVLKNSAVDLWDVLPTDTANYLELETRNPAIEKLARIGMFRLAEELMRVRSDRDLLNKEETEIAKILKIDKERLKRLKAVDGGIMHLKWYQQEKKADTIWPDEMIRDFGNSGFEASSAFKFLPSPMSYIKIWNYLKKQLEINSMEESGTGARYSCMSGLRDTWKDYLNMAEKAGLNVESGMIYKPKDLKASHHEVIMILKNGKMEKEAEKLEKQWPKVNGIVPKLKKFEYSDGKYTVLAPENILDIVKEGTALQHCVDTCDFYFDRIQRDESYLFFLRKAERVNVPWYTLEVEPSGNIRQKRTTGDNQNKDLEDAVKFLKKWQKVFKRRLTEEEKELGAKANQARIEEYAKLRKDGNRVWHGSLAGKLLADVLEADFMEVI